uniref:Uncharacterized protein n=1 Tax=Soybean leaf-associated ssRNA virus 1 TaxID=1719267 RepID=A0A0S1WF47_9VIRU|nr:hypothetical protein [Soybean leaf-associated ssRNA virus 1]
MSDSGVRHSRRGGASGRPKRKTLATVAIFPEDAGPGSQTIPEFSPSCVLAGGITVNLPNPNGNRKTVTLHSGTFDGSASILEEASHDAGRSVDGESYATPSQEGSHRRPFGFRFRKRGRATREIERMFATRTPGAYKAMGGMGYSGGWTSSFSVSTWLRAVMQVDGAKFLSGERVTVGEGDHAVDDWMVCVSLGGGDVCFSLGLYVKLHAYACFRPRTLDMVASLRARAVQCSKELGLPDDYSAFVLAGTVALAHHVLPVESSAWRSLGAVAGLRSERASHDVTVGMVPGVRHVPADDVRGQHSRHEPFSIRSSADWWCALIAGGRRTDRRSIARAAR